MFKADPRPPAGALFCPPKARRWGTAGLEGTGRAEVWASALQSPPRWRWALEDARAGGARVP